jgi:hypothetical protein
MELVDEQWGVLTLVPTLRGTQQSSSLRSLSLIMATTGGEVFPTGFKLRAPLTTRLFSDDNPASRPHFPSYPRHMARPWRLSEMKGYLEQFQSIDNSDGWTTNCERPPALCFSLGRPVSEFTDRTRTLSDLENHDQARSISRFASDLPEHRVVSTLSAHHKNTRALNR